MPTYLLIGIPIVVVIILWGIMSLPDEEIGSEMKMDDDASKSSPNPKKSASKKKKK